MRAIRQWLEKLGLAQYAAAFEANDIDVDVLHTLTEQDLQALGVSLGNRKRLLEALKHAESPTALAGTSPAEGERRQLTVMFCDLVGSTALSEKLDPEELRGLLHEYRTRCGEVIARYEGFVARYVGDGILTYFGWPKAHEQDAERALRAALEIVQAVKRASSTEALSVRIGIATGPVVVGEQAGVGEESKLAVGSTPNLAARLQGLAAADQIVIASSTRRLVGDSFELADLGEHELKGIAELVHVWRVMALSAAASRFEAATQGLVTPLVGREQEIGLLLDRWQHAQEGEGQVVLLSGEPGIGKSRILSTLRERLEDQSVGTLRFQCSPYHVNSALYPSIDNFERVLKFGRDESSESKLDKLEALIVAHYDRPLADVRFIATLLSIPWEARYGARPTTPQKHKDETLRTLVDLTEAAARKQPTVMLYEDLHWADPTTLETLDLLVDRVRTIPLLIVLTHRPEFQPKWGSHGHVTALNLSKLTRAQSTAIVSKLTGGKALPADLLEQILIKTDGVPLYVEELTKSILESGELKDVGDRYDYVGAARSVTIPATLRDSLTARLDRAPAAKEIAQIGAAIGREFSYELIAAVAPHTQTEIDSALNQLTESGLAFRRGTPPDATYTFKHALVQDAAYDSLLKSRRQELHGKIARVIEQRFPNIKETEPEVLARHYTEVGWPEKATPYWIQAGQRAFKRTALAEAISHLERALTLIATLEPSMQRHAWELETRIGLGSAYLALRGWGAQEIETMVQPALVLSEKLQRMDQWLAACYLVQFHWIVTLRLDHASDLATRAIEHGNRLNLDSHRLVGHGMLSWINGSLGEFEKGRRHAEAFRALYQPDRDRQLATLNDVKMVLESWAAHHLWITGWPEQAKKAMNDAIAHARLVGDPFILIFALAHGGAGFFYLRQGSALLDLVDQASRLAKDNALGFLDDMLISVWRGSALIVSGRHSEGYELITGATALSLATNSLIMVPCQRLMTAEGLAGLGRLDEAITLLDGALATIANTHERMHEAEILRMRGVLTLRKDASKSAVAEEFLTRALDLSRVQKARGWELRTAASLARLWQSHGKRKEAYDLLAPVYDWFTEGFDTKDLIEAKALLDQVR